MFFSCSTILFLRMYVCIYYLVYSGRLSQVVFWDVALSLGWWQQSCCGDPSCPHTSNGWIAGQTQKRWAKKAALFAEVTGSSFGDLLVWCSLGSDKWQKSKFEVWFLTFLVEVQYGPVNSQFFGPAVNVWRGSLWDDAMYQWHLVCSFHVFLHLNHD